jgi:OmpA-OmpF porin, OOP family
MRASRVLPAALSFAAATLTAVAAHAQTTATGFDLDQFNPSERGSEWFSEDTLDLRGDPGAAVGIVGELAVRPLVLYNPDGSTRSVPVQDSLILHPGGSVTLFSRVRVGLDIPIAAYQNGTSGSADGVSYPAVTSGGVRLFGQYGDPFTVALGTQLFVPSGNTDYYLGDGSFHAILPRALVAGQVGWFAYAAHVGFHYRGLSTTVAGAQVGSEAVFGASAGVRAADGKLLFGPELYGATGAGGAFEPKSTPVELLLGAHYLVGAGIRLGGGVAPGLTRAYGDPAVRVLLSAEWATSPEAPPPPPQPEPPPPPPRPEPPPPADRDHDGIPDTEDACPDVPGVRTDDPRTNGCPPDRDHDGIIDAEDACPDVPGVKTDDPKTNGCPPDPDRDKDGIPNEQDACPDAAGPPNPDPKKNGCPAAAVVGKQIVIVEQVKFATGSAAILPASNGILTAVAKVLTDHPEIKHLRIEGHTDNVGAPAMNKALSGKRAASVATWLVQHGIEPSRLSSQGFGLERPIDTNDTPLGRQNNRRVEFHIDDEQAQ